MTGRISISSTGLYFVNLTQPPAPVPLSQHLAQPMPPWSMAPGDLQPPPGNRLGVTPEQKSDLLEMWRSVRKRQWAVLALGVVVGLLSLVLVSGMPRVYESSAKVLIEQGKTKVLSVDDLYRSSGQGREYQQTQIEIIKSRENALRTARALKLWQNPALDPRIDRPDTKTKLMRLAGLAQAPGKVEMTVEELASSTAWAVQGGLAVSVIRGSQLLQVNYRSTDPKLAASVANAVIDQFLQSERAERTRFTQEFNQQLREQLTQLREKVLQSERALQAYRDATVAAPVGTGESNFEFTMAGGLTKQLLDVRARRIELENAYRLAQAKSPELYGQVPEVSRDAAVAEATRNLATAKAKLKDVQTGTNVEFAKIDRAKSDVAEAYADLLQRQRAVIDSLIAQYESTRSLEQSLEKSLNSVQGAVQGAARQQVRDEFKVGMLEREYQSTRQFYEQFLNRYRETSAAGDFDTSVGRMVDPALPNYTPVEPDKRRIVTIAVLLALLAGAAASVAVDRLDNTVKGGEDAEVRLKQPLLAALPEVAKSEDAKMARLYLDDGHSHFAEAIRTARTGVMLSSLDTPRKILLITSTLPGEGKTTLATNLALAHAQTKRTLLIDCDMRRSQVSKALNMPPGMLGLSNLVAGTAVAQDCIHPIAESPLLVLPVGDLPPNPLELILSQRFKDTLAQLSEAFEMIIIDSPPVELVSDALVLAPMATSVAYVVRAMSTPAPLVRKNLGRVQRAGGNILGVLVNKLDFKHARMYYGEYGAGNYTYGGYGYGQGHLPYGAKEAKAAEPKSLS